MTTWNNEEMNSRVRQINRKTKSRELLRDIKAKFIEGCKWAVEGYTDPDFVYNYMHDALLTLENILFGLAIFGLITQKQAECTFEYCEECMKGHLKSKGLL